MLKLMMAVTITIKTMMTLKGAIEGGFWLVGWLIV